MPQFLQSFFDQAPSVLLLVFGFGFVIFWHELGHFLAAKWAGVRVDQFAVGFGQALLCWRKGLGLTIGTSANKVQQIVARERESSRTSESDDVIRQRMGISETEYRLNWIPLGGYVKMLGQDDLDPNARSADPRAFNNKSIGKRMVIVSAGVVMNVILALIGFFVLFLIGYNAPPPVVGFVQPGSPAQQAGLEVGDRILTIDGRPQRDFTKIQLNIALVSAGESVPIVVQKPSGATRTLTITPRPKEGDPTGLLMIGISLPNELRGIEDLPRNREYLRENEPLLLADAKAVRPGDTITEINGAPVTIKDSYRLDQALQNSDGKPIELTIKSAEGAVRKESITPRFYADLFSGGSFQLAGLQPRSMIYGLETNSSAKGKLLPGDAVLELRFSDTQDTYRDPGIDQLIDLLRKAGADGRKVDMAVLRDGQRVEVAGLEPNVTLPNGKKGLGIGPSADLESPIVGQVRDDSPAAAARIPQGALLLRVAQTPVSNWHDVFRVLKSQPAGTVEITYQQDGREFTRPLPLTQNDVTEIRSNRYSSTIMLHELTEPRQTKSPIEAAIWGFEETRDLIIQFYFTLLRMVQGSVSAKNATGPIGIVDFGIKVANTGWDRLLWFLCMISANLAVVNFLPIPIVDGGLFVFLILEKIKGRPLSPRAQSVAQLVGLALILSVFVFVTYHDIARLFGRA